MSDQQQRLALKDREIMRLREALGRALEDLVPHHTKASTYKSVNEALASTPATYDDLMAYVESEIERSFEVRDYDYHGQPLYAKKG